MYYGVFVCITGLFSYMACNACATVTCQIKETYLLTYLPINTIDKWSKNYEFRVLHEIATLILVSLSSTVNSIYNHELYHPIFFIYQK